MTFNEFLSGDNFPEGDNIELYVVRNCRDILYIGISKWGVHDRWFYSPNSHMYFIQKYSGTREGGRWVGSSRIGMEIADNFPESQDWEIDLWSLKDGLDFLEINYSYVEDLNNTGIYTTINSVFSIKDVESKMIGALSPTLNVIYNHNTDEKAIVEKRKEYFSFIKARAGS